MGAKTALQLVGLNVARWREEQGISLLELSERSGIDEVKLRQIEAGTLDPYLDHLERLAEALDIQLSELFSPTGG